MLDDFEHLTLAELDAEINHARKAVSVVDNFTQRRECEASLEAFTRQAWPLIEPGTPLVWNWHLTTLCGYLEAFHANRLPDKRLIINVPPGTLKSILVSVMYPAWAWATSPHERFLAISNEQGLCVRDALRMKAIVTSAWYQSKWPIKLREDQNEKTLFANHRTGHRQSQGITAATTGKRGSILLIDDPMDAKQAFSEVIRKAVNETYDQSLSTRLNDQVTSGVLLIMQRLHEDDLTGHLLKKTKTRWTKLVIPMRYEGVPTFDAGKDIGRPELNDPRTQKGELLFEAKFPKKAVDALEEDLGEYGAAGQLQQRPVPEGGGIIKKHWWRIWPDDQALPVCTHIFHSWDTAFSEADSKLAAYSACTRWGIFWHEQRERYCILALGLWFDRVGYHELRAKVKEFDKKYQPDANLVEKKATGITLIQDLRRASPGRVRVYTPKEDKISRGHSVSPMVQSGLVYVPNKTWAVGSLDKKTPGLIDYIADFPGGSPPAPDVFDTMTQALIYLRSMRWAGDHPDDHDDIEDVPRHDGRSDEEKEDHAPSRRRAIYG